tara:strand:- start:1793 stop:2014 length:222 start_codon:yes stop_codon:yes gene_type:complete
MNKQYNSFEEIDERLNILRVHREIAVEDLKLKFNKTKSNLQPSHFFGNLSGNIQQMLLVFAIKKMTTFFRRKR